MDQGNLLLQQQLDAVKKYYLKGDKTAALVACRQLLKSHPGRLTTLRFLSFLGSLKDPKKSLFLIDKCLELDPYDPYSLMIKGKITLEEGLCESAIRCFSKALIHDVLTEDAYYYLGIAYLQLDDYEIARHYFSQLLTIEEWKEKASFSLSFLLYKEKKIEESLDAFLKLTQTYPKNAEYQYFLGCCYSEHKLYAQSQRSFERALELNPSCSHYYQSLGKILYMQGKVRASLNTYQLGLKLYPENLNLRSDALFVSNFISEYREKDLYEEHLKWGECVHKIYEHKYDHSNRVFKNKKIKIGYISSDFRRHSIAYFFLPLVSGYDKEKIHITCYFSSNRSDEISEQIKCLVDDWKDVPFKNPVDLAQMIYEDEIQILVDLSGHTTGNQLPVFSMKPAPIQISYLGYPNTTGLKDIDYKITDAIADPFGEDSYYSETLLRLPRGFLCFSPPDMSLDLPLPPCATNKYLTFGSMNTFAKINENVLSLWLVLLKQIPNSRLLLKNISFESEGVKERLMHSFVRSGIERERILLKSPISGWKEHLLVYNEIDISLDTYPYNGTTTTFESLWMGVPVVSLSGATHRSRVGKSILSHLGVKEWVADTKELFLDICSSFDQEQNTISYYKKNLRSMMKESPLCHYQYTSEVFDSVYIKLWGDYLKKMGS